MAIKEDLAKIFGVENILDKPDVLQRYASDHSFVRETMPQCIVKAQDVTQVQKVVQFANQSGIPLTPVSSGEPHFRGDTISLSGGIIVDMSRMNKIVRIDRLHRVAMIESGVTFAKLQPELKKEGLRLPGPLCPRSSKSVVASCLEEEPITIPKYHVDMSAPLLCTEVVFGTGDIFRTGEASGPGTVEQQWEVGRVQKWDAGPGQISFHRLLQCSQGNIGIVTWATVRCEVLPKIHKLLLVGVDRVDTVIDFVYRILRLKLSDECLLLNSLNLASILGGTTEIDTLRQALPSWALLLGIAGYETLPEVRIEQQENDIIEIASQFGLVPVDTLPGAKADEVLKTLNEPASEPYWKLRYKGDCYDIFFLTTLDKAPKFVSVMYQIAEAYKYPVTHMGIYIQPVQQGRACHCEFNLTCDSTDSKQVTKVHELFLSASETLAKEGGFFSRPYGPWADIAYCRDTTTREAVRKLKGVFDPGNILNPGKLF